MEHMNKRQTSENMKIEPDELTEVYRESGRTSNTAN